MSVSAEAICVDPKQIEPFWEKAAPWIKDAMERGDLGTFSDVRDDVLNGAALLWLVWSDPIILGATVTQIIVQENRKICMIVACGGEDAQAWLHLISKIENYARAEGCELVRIVGRKGWMRMLPDYKESRVILEKVI